MEARYTETTMAAPQTTSPISTPQCLSYTVWQPQEILTKKSRIEKKLHVHWVIYTPAVLQKINVCLYFFYKDCHI